MPRSTDLEIDLMLALELDFTVVEPPGAVHQPVHSNEIVGLEPVVLVGGDGARLRVRLHSHAASPLSARARPPKFHYNRSASPGIQAFRRDHTGTKPQNAGRRDLRCGCAEASRIARDSRQRVKALRGPRKFGVIRPNDLWLRVLEGSF